jgi:hypothetical protein
MLPLSYAASVRVTAEALDAYISGLPCQSANVQIASKSVSASAVVDAPNGSEVYRIRH